jgi:hypothetical protein
MSCDEIAMAKHLRTPAERVELAANLSSLRSFPLPRGKGK